MSEFEPASSADAAQPPAAVTSESDERAEQAGTDTEAGAAGAQRPEAAERAANDDGTDEAPAGIEAPVAAESEVPGGNDADASSAVDPETSDAATGDRAGGVRTGHAESDAVLDSLDGLDQRPVQEHVAVFEKAHEDLRSALTQAHDDAAS